MSRNLRMKAKQISSLLPGMARRGAMISCLLVCAAAMPVAMAEEPANPDSKPLKDDSAKASPEAQPVKDSSEAAGKDSRRVLDDGKQANNNSRETEGDAIPVEDNSGKANPNSGKVNDSSQAAGNDSRRVDDSDMNRASPDASRKTDRSVKADPRAAEVQDGNMDKANPASRPATASDRAKQATPPPVAPEPTNFEKETAVREAVTAAEESVRLSKLEIKQPAEARAIIDGILAADGPVSRVEQQRGAELADEALHSGDGVPDEMRAETEAYLRDRLRGQLAPDRKLPKFFRDRGDDDVVGLVPSDESPRFLHSGRRYVHFHSRTSIPSVLLANAALGYVSIYTPAEANRLYTPDEADLAVLPQEYRGGDARVLSYPVSEKSMISTNDITFQRGSTQFADAHSYEMARILSAAMKDNDFAGIRFVIEGHASAEGTFEENQILSQQRAEAIARELVRNGLEAERVIPVGFGASEARHPPTAPEAMRSMDRRVAIFRIEEPGLAR
ncbi:OmpA family protein [Luteolibacter luteus]|uniref:OmpA family protein n=1 Tax=Luteolibacter luteus TaxID=2728835 RepID=A0A858RFF3_9BACT|nr:OmpA family protein [Luteolibacter luteus]QJE95169.1 OmpA family protein [Luteolibacter luteus]